jgi:hypothetical protein
MSPDDMYQVGKILDQVVFPNGERSRKGRKLWSVRRISKVLGTVSPAQLTRCGQLWELAQDLGFKPPFKGVPAALFINLGGLPRGERKKVALQAFKEGWTRERIAEAVQSKAGTHGAGFALDRAVELVRNIDSDPAVLDTRKLGVLRKKLKQLKRELEKLERKL